MKNNIIMLVIGILIGAIIATGVFMALKSTDTNNQMQGPRGDMSSMDENGTPPSRPVDNTTNNNTTVNDTNTSNNTQTNS